MRMKRRLKKVETKVEKKQLLAVPKEKTEPN